MNSIRFMQARCPNAAPPTNAENRALCWAAQNAATAEERLQARNELILRNQGLIGKAARRFYGRCWLSMDDLISEGQFGLIRAIEGYKLDQGAAFSNYATASIGRAICDALRAHGQLIRVPSKYSDPEYASPFRADADRARGIGALDDYTASNLPDRESDRATASELERRDLLARLMRRLSVRQREVVRLYYGLGKQRKAYLSDRRIAEEIGLTHQRVSQLRNAAIDRMRLSRVVRKEMSA